VGLITCKVTGLFIPPQDRQNATRNWDRTDVPARGARIVSRQD
jgi:hypothetical protein